MRRGLSAVVIAGLIMFWIGYLGAIRDPVVVRYRVALAGLSRPVRLVHLSDIHASAWDMPEVRIARIVGQANALRPDMVVITGDFHSSKIINPPMRLEAALRPLMALRAPLGVWSVPGNHDPPDWLRRTMQLFGLKLLVGELVDIGPLQIVGADDHLTQPGAVAGFARAAATARPDKPLIGLTHGPKLWLAVPPNVQLLLAGHTHGGQVIGLPRAPSFYESHPRGLFQGRQGQQLLVSAGLGTTFLPIRIGVPPEIVVVELVPKPGADQPPGRNSGTER